jgi:hypothetical protein
MSQLRRSPEENPEHGTHCTFLAGRWQNSNSTKPPLIGQAYFSTCCGSRLLLVALPLSREIVDRSNNSSLFEIQGYRCCPGNSNLTTLILVYNSKKMHKSQSLFYLTTALHVSGVTITHLQEHKTTVTTASGNRYTVIDRVKFYW